MANINTQSTSVEMQKYLTPTTPQQIISGRTQKTIQTHKNISVPATNGFNDSNFIDCNGFDRLGVTFYSDTAIGGQTLSLIWSNDEQNIHGYESSLTSTSGTNRYVAFETSIKARYLKIRISNTDSSPHTINGWTYLKA